MKCIVWLLCAKYIPIISYFKPHNNQHNAWHHIEGLILKYMTISVLFLRGCMSYLLLWITTHFASYSNLHLLSYHCCGSRVKLRILWCHLRLNWENICFWAYVVVDISLLPMSCRTENLRLLLPIGQRPPFLTHGLPTQPLTSSKSGDETHYLRKVNVTVSCDIITEVKSLLLFVILVS